MEKSSKKQENKTYKVMCPNCQYVMTKKFNPGIGLRVSDIIPRSENWDENICYRCGAEQLKIIQVLPGPDPEPIPLQGFWKMP